MRLHSDKITNGDVYAALKAAKDGGQCDRDVHFDKMDLRRSRSRSNAFEIKLRYAQRKAPPTNRRIKMKRTTIPALAIAALLGLTACGAAAESTLKPTAAPATESQAATAAPAAPATTAPPKAKDNHSALMVKFGETIEYADGLQITVKHVGTSVGSDYAAPETARGAEVQLFELTLVNGTADTFEPAVFSYSAVSGKAGAKAEKVFDSTNGTSAGYFSGVMVPGGTQTITTALQIPSADLATTAFSISPSFKHKASVVTGGL